MIGKTQFEWDGTYQYYMCCGEICRNRELIKICKNCKGPLGSHVYPEDDCWDEWEQFYPKCGEKIVEKTK